jgi:thymidylate synthase (FAD)
MTAPLIDPHFRVDVFARTENPQTLCWWAMHQDYCEQYVYFENPPSETEAGDLVVKHLLTGERGHYGPLEHPAITFACGYFPHSVMQQARTHRVGVSFDVQSGRYTGQRIAAVAASQLPLEEVFYLRPTGKYRDRQGHAYDYTPDQRRMDWARCYDAAANYAAQLRAGYAEEHARDLIPYAIRQHFVVSFSLRALLHFLDLRSKKDAQLEIQQLCDLIWPHLQSWAPEIAAWYGVSRLHKARLAP